jgi:hypothetical protein
MDIEGEFDTYSCIPALLALQRTNFIAVRKTKTMRFCIMDSQRQMLFRARFGLEKGSRKFSHCFVISFLSNGVVSILKLFHFMYQCTIITDQINSLSYTSVLRSSEAAYIVDQSDSQAYCRSNELSLTYQSNHFNKYCSRSLDSPIQLYRRLCSYLVTVHSMK